MRPFTHRAFVFVLLGCVCYSLWLGQPWFNPNLPLWTSFVSELAATGQPSALLMRTGDTLTALWATIAAAAGWKSRAFSRVSCILIWGFALFTLLDVVFPMACAPSQSAACAAGDAAGTLGLRHSIHVVTSALANAATFALAGWWVWQHRCTRDGLAFAATLCAAAHIVTGLVTGTLAVATSAATGVFQRLSLLTLLAWVLLAAWVRFDALRKGRPCIHP